MVKTRIGENPDGSPHFRFELTEAEHKQGRVLFVTGPIAGTMSLPDGVAYDVSEAVIAVKREHVGELHLAIHRAHHAAGRFLKHPVPELAAVALSD